MRLSVTGRVFYLLYYKDIILQIVLINCKYIRSHVINLLNHRDIILQIVLIDWKILTVPFRVERLFVVDDSEM